MTDNRLSEALVALGNSELDRAESILRDILRNIPSDVHALHFLGVILCQKGSFESGTRLIEQSISLDSTRFAPYLNLGKLYLDNDQAALAIPPLKMACKINSLSFDAHYLLAKSFFSAGDIHSATQSANRSIEIQPSNSEALYLLGLITSESDKELAISYYTKAIAVDPCCYRALVNIGNLHSQRRCFNDAIVFFQWSLSIEPSCLKALSGMAYCYKQISRFGDAINFYTKVLEIDPASIDTYFSLAELYKEESDLDKCIICLRQALEVNSDHPEVLYMLSISLMDAGRISESLEYAKQYNSLNSFDSTLYERLAGTCERLSYRLNDEKLYLIAKSLFQEVLRIRPQVKTFNYPGRQ